MRSIPTAALALALFAPLQASAGNEAHPRTPVLWPTSECARVVDRDDDPIVHFEYAIPFEDTQLGPEELADSRTHQFFALCRQRAVTELLPNWISLDDVERATQAGMVEPGSVHDSAVLDTSAEWADCFVRITADDDRRPISFAAAEQGFDWDLAGVPNGVWQVAGYTFEPALNLWRAQPGFVKVVDDPDDPAQDLPAAHTGETPGAWTGELNDLELCVDVLEPATAIVEWARFEPQLVWAELGRTTIEQDGVLTLAVAGPPVPDGPTEGLLRVRVIDALDREYVAHHPSTLLFEPCNGECGEPPPEDDPQPEDPRGCSTGDPGLGSLHFLFIGLVFVLCAKRRTKRRSR